MDEEDMKEQEESQALQTKDTFAGLGSTGEDAKRQSLLLGIFRPEGDTMGVKLLRKMGWRDGQGVGARVRRKPRFGDVQDDDTGAEHLFAPENTQILTFTKKTDHKGLGYSGEERLETTRAVTAPEHDEDVDTFGSGPVIKRAIIKSRKGGIGTGVLNDLGSDDEDAYDIGPRISYNRVIGGDKKKAKKGQKPTTLAPTANPLLQNKPVFLSKKAIPAKFRKCHDGRLPLPGFVLADPAESASIIPDDEKYPRPSIPVGWKSSKAQSATTQAPYVSTADVAKASKLDPKACAALLGEAQLPSKSVFDFLSASARDRVAAASGRSNLPLGRGETIPNASRTAKSTSETSAKNHDPTLIPDLDKTTALAALSRGIGGWTPYADNPSKSARYRSFLSFRGGLIPSLPPPLPSSSKEDDLTPEARLQELQEFAHAARVFKPMTGMMASRFTSSTAVPATSTSATDKHGDDGDDKPILLHTPSTTKSQDPAEAAAKAGMFGPLTRSVLPFAPTRLLCKRFGVRAPAQVQADGEGGEGGVVGGGADRSRREPMVHTSAAPDLVSQEMMEVLMREAGVEPAATSGGNEKDVGTGDEVRDVKEVVDVGVDVQRNEALEGKRAAEALFRSVFGNDSDEG